LSFSRLDHFQELGQDHGRRSPDDSPAKTIAGNLNNKPAVKPFADVRMQLVAGNCMAAPTVTDAEILVGEVRTNVSAIIP
jgi:hypothetical protein